MKLKYASTCRSFFKPLGFTLLEVMFTVAIVGILAAIAYPSYLAFITDSNRVEAMRELVRIANLQEQYFIDTRSYTGDLSDLGVSSTSKLTTESENYIIEVMNFDINSGSFTLRATAQGKQASSDSGCLWMEVTNTGKKSAKSSDCWEG